jgi:Xaa-Pro aminopeptidase
MAVTEVVPDDVALRVDRRERVLAEMERDGVDILVVGREGNARYVSGAPRLWTAGSRAFGPGCVLVRSSCAVHLLSTWDEGVPEEIPHEHLYGISFNSTNFLKVLQGVEGAATVGRVATDALTPSSAGLLAKAFPAAELVDGEPLLRRARAVKTTGEIDAIRTSVAVAERALDAAAAALAPGVTERALTGVFMEAMASAGVTTPASQDVAWITSSDDPWRRASRDAAVAPGDLVVLEGGVIAGGYAGEVGRTHEVASVASGARFRECDALLDRLMAACRPGAPASALLDAYAAAGVAPPPMPVARGLGLGYDLPLVTHALPRTAGEQRLAAGMTFALAAYVWERGAGGVLRLEPVVVTADGAQSLSTQGVR